MVFIHRDLGSLFFVHGQAWLPLQFGHFSGRKLRPVGT
jgi:hypothetical protein